MRPPWRKHAIYEDIGHPLPRASRILGHALARLLNLKQHSYWALLSLQFIVLFWVQQSISQDPVLQPCRRIIVRETYFEGRTGLEVQRDECRIDKGAKGQLRVSKYIAAAGSGRCKKMNAYKWTWKLESRSKVAISV